MSANPYWNWGAYSPYQGGNIFSFSGPNATLQKAAYDMNPTFAWSYATRAVAPDTDRPLAQYIQGQQQDAYQRYAAASTQNPNLTFSDWINQHMGDYLNRFQGLSATQRGENPLAFNGGFAGRFLG